MNFDEVLMYRPFEKFQLKGNFISVIGSGGKTSFLRYFASHLEGRVILTTSTHIYPFPDMPLVKTGTENSPVSREQILQEIRSALARSRVICLGQPLSNGKLASPSPAISFEALSLEADYVLVEADGSAGHPLKAHRSFEPVIPACSTMTVCLAGASGIGKPVSQVCHCPDLFSALAGISPDQPVYEDHIARVLNCEDLADYYLINQIDTLEEPDRALRLCELIRKEASVCSLRE